MQRHGPQGGTPVREPILNAPGAVIWAIGLLLAAHLVFQLIDELTSARLQLALAFVPARYSDGGPIYPGDPAGAALWSFFTHQLVHADWTHVGLNSAWLLAFGGAVATRIGAVRFAALALLSGAVGAAVYLLLNWGELSPMAGASGAVSGLMGAAMRFMFSTSDDGMAGFGSRPTSNFPRLDLSETLRHGRARIFIAIWLALNLAVAFVAPLVSSVHGIAWEAHIGGFAFGLVAFALFDVPAPAIESRD